MSDDDQATITTAVAEYRRQLAEQADIAAADLDEIDDHLRSLVDDLRNTGLPTAALK